MGLVVDQRTGALLDGALRYLWHRHAFAEVAPLAARERAARRDVVLLRIVPSGKVFARVEALEHVRARSFINVVVGEPDPFFPGWVRLALVDEVGRRLDDGSKLERGPIILDKPDDGDEKTIDSID